MKSNKIKYALLSFALIAPLSVSFAMCIDVNYQTVAWNSSGTAAIIHKISRGPEGGGAESYMILDFKKERNETYDFSSDFSLGGADTPQIISINTCRDHAVKANHLLSDLGLKSRFKESCLPDRTNMLSVIDEPFKQLPPDKTTEIEQALGLKNTNILSTRDGIHFVATSNESDCVSTCKRIIFDNTHKRYKELGNCNNTN